MAEYNPRLDGATLQGGGLVTQEVFDSIMRKNGRARKRMARRMMRKRTDHFIREIGADAAQCRQYTPLELANHIGRGWSAKAKRTHAKRVKDIDKSIEAQWRAGNYPWMRERENPCAVPERPVKD